MRLGICEIKAWTETNVINMGLTATLPSSVPALPAWNTLNTYHVRNTDNCVNTVIDVAASTDVLIQLSASFTVQSVFLGTTPVAPLNTFSDALSVAVGSSTDHSLNTECSSGNSLSSTIFATVECNGAMGEYITISKSVRDELVLCHVGVLASLCPANIVDLPILDPSFSYGVKTFIVDNIISVTLAVVAPTFASTEAVECFRVQEFKLLDPKTGNPTSLSFINTYHIRRHLFTPTSADISREPYFLRSIAIVNDEQGTEIDTGLTLEVHVHHRCWSAFINPLVIDSFTAAIFGEP